MLPTAPALICLSLYALLPPFEELPTNSIPLIRLYTRSLQEQALLDLNEDPNSYPITSLPNICLSARPKEPSYSTLPRPAAYSIHILQLHYGRILFHICCGILLVQLYQRPRHAINMGTLRFWSSMLYNGIGRRLFSIRTCMDY